MAYGHLLHRVREAGAASLSVGVLAKLQSSWKDGTSMNTKEHNGGLDANMESLAGGKCCQCIITCSTRIAAIYHEKGLLGDEMRRDESSRMICDWATFVVFEVLMLGMGVVLHKPRFCICGCEDGCDGNCGYSCGCSCRIVKVNS